MAASAPKSTDVQEAEDGRSHVGHRPPEGQGQASASKLPQKASPECPGELETKTPGSLCSQWFRVKRQKQSDDSNV